MTNGLKDRDAKHLATLLCAVTDGTKFKGMKWVSRPHLRGRNLRVNPKERHAKCVICRRLVAMAMRVFRILHLLSGMLSGSKG